MREKQFCLTTLYSAISISAVMCNTVIHFLRYQPLYVSNTKGESIDTQWSISNNEITFAWSRRGSFKYPLPSNWSIKACHTKRKPEELALYFFSPCSYKCQETNTVLHKPIWHKLLIKVGLWNITIHIDGTFHFVELASKHSPLNQNTQKG